MRIFDRFSAALFALLVAIAPARADTTTVTASGWTEIGAGTIIVNALDPEGVLLKDGATAPTGTIGDLRIPWGVISPPLTTSTKWWARPGNSAASTRVGVVTQAASGSSAQSGAGYSASGVTPVAGSLSATGASAVFAPLAGRSFNVTIWGTFSATCVLKRSFDQGATWLKITAGGGQLMSFTGPVSEQWQEPEFGVQYRLDCTVASGTVSYRISQ